MWFLLLLCTLILLFSSESYVFPVSCRNNYMLYMTSTEEHRSKVVVFGSTGRTGREVVKALRELPNISVVCVAKDTPKARRMYGPDQQNLQVVPGDMVRDSPAKLASLVKGADCVVCAAGNSQVSLTGAYDVDYKGTVKTIDACVDARVGKYILVSSILTNGLAAGQLLNPQYLLLNAIGGVLVWKRKAEVHLQQSLVRVDHYYSYHSFYPRVSIPCMYRSITRLFARGV